jgi:hypothetical protein
MFRYSAEYTVYREVLQNANDAGAPSVEILFEEQKKEETSRVTSITIRNNGRPFNQDDWARLRKIAEGNPDEQKIGFFGVGFYSLFSICEEPFVVSGKSCMAFYWVGDQLYARPGPAPIEMDANWTTIFLKLRDNMERPYLDAFAHFLCKSLLFTQSLERVIVQSGDEILFRIEKKRTEPTTLSLTPQWLLSSCTSKPSGLFTIQEAQMQAVQLDLDKRYTSEPLRGDRSILSSIWSIAKNIAKDKDIKMLEEAMTKPGVFSLFLHIVDCKVRVKVSSAFSTAMERVTKKRPASSFKLALLYSTYDEVEASSGKAVKHPVLSGVLPGMEAGKIFIGFETHQTTGCAVHVAGPFIPTVERESLDFVDKTLAQWNGELVKICGKMIRLLYEIEIQSLQKLFPERKSDVPAAFWNRAGHIMKAFGVGPSSPSPAPGNLVLEEFFNAGSRPFLLPSTVGVVPLEDIRTIPLQVSYFIKDIPVLDTSKWGGADRLVGTILRFNTIQPASFNEIITSLGGRKLSDAELISCLEWIISIGQSGHVGLRSLYSMVSNIIVPVGQGDTLQHAPLSKTTHYPAGSLCYESKMPLPVYCLSPKITERIPGHELSSIFNLKELGMSEWISFVTRNQYLQDAIQAEKVLAFLSGLWGGIDDAERASVASILSIVQIIPTKHGLQKPGDSYMEDVAVFGDVATVVFTNRRAISDLFLLALGVQSHLEVPVIFSKLNDLKWDHRQLIKYMVRIREQLSQDELKMLQTAKVFPSINSQERFSLRDLYLDNDVVRLLGLPVLEWKPGEGPSTWSDTTKFMIELGLNSTIPWNLLLQRVADTDDAGRVKIFNYFINNFHSSYASSYDPSKVDFNFIPLKGSEGLERPLNVFSDDGVVFLGFKVMQPELKPYAALFGIKSHPPSEVLCQVLISRKFAVDDVKVLFSYLSTIIEDFSDAQLQQLARSEFIPSNGIYYRPTDVFFKRGRFDRDDIFPVVPYGETRAHAFLRACGVQDEPQTGQVAVRVCKEPGRFLAKLGADTYLDLLRWLSLQFAQLPNEAVRLLKTAPVLLGIDYNVEAGKEKADEIAESQYCLASAMKLFVIDDTIAQQQFKCLAVPSDTALEQFYDKLGARRLSACVQMTWQHMGVPTATVEASALQELIRTRAPLLVAEGPSTGKFQPKALSHLVDLEAGEVEGIIITRTFEGRSHNQRTTACLKSEKLLLITPEYEIFDVAQTLARLVYVGGKMSETLMLETLLALSLGSLRAKGFPVDRVLGNKMKPAKPQLEESEVMPPQNKQQEVTLPKQQGNAPLPEAGPFQPPPDTSKKRSSLWGVFKDIFRSDHHHASVEGPPSTLPDKVNDTAIKQSLAQSIASLRQHDRSTIDDKGGHTPVPVPITGEDDSQYCEIVPGHSLRYLDTVNGISVYITKSLNQTAVADFFNNSADMLHAFAHDLLLMAQIFGASPSVVHIFHDPSSRAIAFNRNMTLFFNLDHYRRQIRGGLPRQQLLASWFMTFCHELAHNFIHQHDQRHEYYMSCYAEAYLSTFMDQLTQ